MTLNYHKNLSRNKQKLLLTLYLPVYSELSGNEAVESLGLAYCKPSSSFMEWT